MKNHHQTDYNYKAEAESSSTVQRRRFKKVIVIIFIVILMLIVVLIHINQYVQLSRKNIQIERLKDKRNQLKTETAHLRLKLSRLISLKRIERLASEKLGMKQPEEINYVVLNTTTSKEKSVESKSKEKSQNFKLVRRKFSAKLISWFDNFRNAQADTLDK